MSKVGCRITFTGGLPEGRLWDRTLRRVGRGCQVVPEATLHPLQHVVCCESLLLLGGVAVGCGPHGGRRHRLVGNVVAPRPRRRRVAGAGGLCVAGAPPCHRADSRSSRTRGWISICCASAPPKWAAWTLLRCRWPSGVACGTLRCSGSGGMRSAHAAAISLRAPRRSTSHAHFGTGRPNARLIDRGACRPHGRGVAAGGCQRKWAVAGTLCAHSGHAAGALCHRLWRCPQ